MYWYCKKLVHLQLTLMDSATTSDNTFVTGLAAEKYFAVKLQLVPNIYI